MSRNTEEFEKTMRMITGSLTDMAETDNQKQAIKAAACAGVIMFAKIIQDVKAKPELSDIQAGFIIKTFVDDAIAVSDRITQQGMQGAYNEIAKKF